MECGPFREKTRPGSSCWRRTTYDLCVALERSIYNGKLKRAADLLEDSARLWIALSLANQYGGCMRDALDRVKQTSEPHVRDEMRSRVMLAQALTLTHEAATGNRRE
jgi:hypothetical protein